MLLERDKLPSKLKQVVTFMQTDKKSAKRDFEEDQCTKGKLSQNKAVKGQNFRAWKAKKRILEIHSNTVNEGAWLWYLPMNAVNLIN